MDDRLNSIETRLERVENKLDKMVDIQADMRADVREHIRRTAIAEHNISKLADNMAPVQKHVAAVQGLGVFITILAAAIGAAFTLYQLLGN